ncbi:MAG TPA: dihydrofolate reductase family protein, partial [Methylophilus sp.]
LIAYAHDSHDKAAALLAAGATLLNIPNADGQVCLHTLLAHLAREQVNELMVEAGQGLNGALVALGLVDELLLYVAPKLMGGHAKSMLDMPSLTQMQQALDVNILEMRAVGKDMRIRAQIVKTDA